MSLKAEIWTAERMEILRAMWTGGASSGEISRALGVVSRNAVMGKVNRMGLMGCQNAAPVPPAPEVAPVPEPVRAPEAWDPPVMHLFQWERPREDGRPNVLGLKAESCRWPIGDPSDADFHFCGGEAQLPKSYCAEHCKAAFQVRDPNRVSKPWSPMRVAQARAATIARLRTGRTKVLARA